MTNKKQNAISSDSADAKRRSPKGNFSCDSSDSADAKRRSPKGNFSCDSSDSADAKRRSPSENHKKNVILAFSGGADSVYLLHMLLAQGKKPILAHLNHSLRGSESDADEKFCVKVAKKHNLKIEVGKIPPPKNEEEARSARYDFLVRVRQKHKAAKIFTAHHLNDSIETILLNVTRGTGIHGLTGIQADKIKRPLLHTTKEEILSYLKKHRINYREDSSNQDPKFSRNRIRLKVLPELKKINKSLEKTFLGNIENFKDIQNFIDTESKKYIHSDHIKIGDFAKLHKALQTNIIIRLAGPNTSQKEVSEIRKTMLGNRTGTKCKIGTIEYGKLMLKPYAKSFPVKFSILTTKPKKFAQKCAYLNFDKIKDIQKLETRTWQTGDRMIPIGMKGSKKLQDIFTDKKISQSSRKSIPVIIFGSEIVSIGWIATSEAFKVTPETRQILKITFKDIK